MMFFRKRKPRKLEKQVAELQAEIEKLTRTVSIRDHEIELLAGVIARDRERVKAETATLAIKTAENER